MTNPHRLSNPKETLASPIRSSRANPAERETPVAVAVVVRSTYRLQEMESSLLRPANGDRRGDRPPIVRLAAVWTCDLTKYEIPQTRSLTPLLTTHHQQRVTITSHVGFFF
jgi:hypothetical protein